MICTIDGSADPGGSTVLQSCHAWYESTWSGGRAGWTSSLPGWTTSPSLPSCAPCGRVSLYCAGENHDPPRGSLPSARGARTELASAPRLRDQRVRVAVSGKKDGHKPINSRSAGQTVPVWLSLWSNAPPNAAGVSRVSGYLSVWTSTATPGHLHTISVFCPRLGIIALQPASLCRPTTLKQAGRFVPTSAPAEVAHEPLTRAPAYFCP